MREKKNTSFVNLDAAARGISILSARPAIITVTAGLAMLAASWGMLIAMGTLAAKTALGEDSGPGASLLRMLPDIELPTAFTSFFALCFGKAEYLTGGISVYLALWAMWFLMAIAMMLPSAAPMIRTYCDIAETAHCKGIRTVHPLVLLSGYLSVWGAMAALLAAATLLANNLGASNAYALPVSGLFAPLALTFAALYQFTGLKRICLTKCRNPFQTLFAKWSDKRGAVFELGVEEGLYCAGCCWALMLVMFVVGIMNVFWMALLAMLAIVEKSKHARWVTPASGVILLVWAAALMFYQV